MLPECSPEFRHRGHRPFGGGHLGILLVRLEFFTHRIAKHPSSSCLLMGISRWTLRPTQADAGFIASYKKPRRVEFVDMLPRTESGEVDREQVIPTYA